MAWRGDTYGDPHSTTSRSPDDVCGYTRTTNRALVPLFLGKHDRALLRLQAQKICDGWIYNRPLNQILWIYSPFTVSEPKTDGFFSNIELPQNQQEPSDPATIEFPFLACFSGQNQPKAKLDLSLSTDLKQSLVLCFRSTNLLLFSIIPLKSDS